MSVIVFYLIFSMLATIWFDVSRYIIPNWLVASLLVLYPVAIYMNPNPVDWRMGLLAFGIMFAAGYLIFAMRWMGGGDVKLLMVCAMWVGFSKHLAEYVIVVSLLGGALSLLLWGGRKALVHVPRKRGAQLPRVLRESEPVPYGVAIAIAFLIWLAHGNIPPVH